MICTEAAFPAEADVQVSINGLPSMPLASRSGAPGSIGWYQLPVDRAVAEASRTLDVVIERRQAAGGLVRICGGRDDPARARTAGAARRESGNWSPVHLADVAVPPVGGRPAPGRLYVELRFYDGEGAPTVGIWY